MATGTSPRGSRHDATADDVTAVEDDSRAETATFLISLDDEDCPDVSVHVAAYRGNVARLTSLLARVAAERSYSAWGYCKKNSRS